MSSGGDDSPRVTSVSHAASKSGQAGRGQSHQIRRCGLAGWLGTLGTNGGVDVISDTDLPPTSHKSTLHLTINLISPLNLTEEAN